MRPAERVGCVDMSCMPPRDRPGLTHFGFHKTCEECGSCDSPGWRSFRAWSARTMHLRDPYTHPTCQPPMDRGPHPFAFPQRTCMECGNCDSPMWRSFRAWSAAEDAKNYEAMWWGPEADQADHMVGAFFYDPDLAQFGNAISPFVDLSYEQAQRAMQLPFEDRYGPRLDAPSWQDYFDYFPGSDW
jgi:hypothetical protein